MENNKKFFEDQAEIAKDKKIISFDLDGTLAESKMSIDSEMAELLKSLLSKKTVAVIGGGSYELFKEQFLFSLKCEKDLLPNLLLLPTSGATFCRYENNSWITIHEDILTEEERGKIKKGIIEVYNSIDHFIPSEVYGPMIEDRGTEVTFSALGMKAPLEKKKEWNKKYDIRRDMVKKLHLEFPNFEIRLGGLTSLDITKKGIDKAHGINQIMKRLSVTKNDIIYIGDALYEDGNDEAVLITGVDTVQVSNPEDTKMFIKSLLLTLKK